MRNDIAKSLGAIFGFISLIFILIFFGPWIYFWFAYFGGWIAKITIGGYLVNGLELLGINISIDNVPLIAGALGWIGGFFKSSATAYQNLITKNDN